MPYAARVTGSRRSMLHRPWSDTIAGMASSNAATPILVATAAAGVHPASSSDRAREPDMLKVAAERSANAMPARRLYGAVIPKGRAGPSREPPLPEQKH